MSDKIQRTGYMSEIDQFLRDFNQNRKEVPDSVQKEVQKAQKIAEKRDGVVGENDSRIWKDF
jgi:hypothetical protein